MSIIGIDFGKNIGVAMAVESLAVPCFSTQSLSVVSNKIKEVKATLLVVGWPLLLSGEPGNQCLQTELMLKNLLKLTGDIPFVFQDERFSSKFIKFNNNHANSAAWILQLFLDSNKNDK